MKIWAFILLVLICCEGIAQQRRDDIYSSFVLYGKKQQFDFELRQRVVAYTFAMQPDSLNEYKFESACNAISQFQLRNDTIKAGLQHLFNRYPLLEYDTRRALLEATYAVYPDEFVGEVSAALTTDTVPKLFAMAAAYLFRKDSSISNANMLKIAMIDQFPEYDSNPILLELEKFLNNHAAQIRSSTPDLAVLFRHNRNAKRKSIYSIQRWDRDQPGIAIVQNADGRFARHADGRLMIFEQLARSASDLPYFITNGSTPQGVYSIQGIAVSKSQLIGPTPNLQLVMPFESRWQQYFQQPDSIPWDSSQNVQQLYNLLLPSAWAQYAPMQEVFNAGQIGRTEIIAHGTAIDPEYFKNKPYYPLTPTMGCLAAKELWNTTNGRLLVSEQFNLVSAFSATPGSKGFLFVINIDHQHKPVTRADLEETVRRFEKE
ncbi:hypothetical protein HHL16_18150 [Pseudoflavitalea sp. G-6-1-2]|uniref:hypothetical protein n=1 Tax=Pseudoflavitalea sp. G-6-1-2 TaxID=2728841 RepID=UPI00146C57CE|nr:hypothetical protein [Pseudoflavitalea sp. G-6-1-2]NML22813.1 hypothetical protein [Pseudoflavitalea sp. G-6-1-2]